MASIKTLGRNGQISLGRRYAGRQVVVDELEPGVWLVKVGEFVPDSERLLHEPDPKAKLARAEHTPFPKTDLDDPDHDSAYK